MTTPTPVTPAELAKRLRSPCDCPACDIERKQAADLIDQQAARIAELERETCNLHCATCNSRSGPIGGPGCICVVHNKHAVSCIFCDFGGNLAELKEHSTSCAGHPMAARIAALEAEVERLKGFETAYKVFMEKTDWVQEQMNRPEQTARLPASLLGMHRADVMTKTLESQEREIIRLTTGVDLLLNRIDAEQDKTSGAELRLAATERERDQLICQHQYRMDESEMYRRELATAKALLERVRQIDDYDYCHHLRPEIDSFLSQPDAGGGDAESAPAEKTGCEDCGRQYGNEHGFPNFIIPNYAWRRISTNHDDSGLLCPSCIVARLVKAGMTQVYGAFMSGPVQSVSEPVMYTFRWMENLREQGNGWNCPACNGAREQGDEAKGGG